MENHKDELIPIGDDRSYKAINRLLTEETLRCPECGAHQNALIVMSDTSIVKPRYLIACSECKYQGPFAKNIPRAVDCWNKPLGFFAALRRRRARKRLKQSKANAFIAKTTGANPC